MARLRAAAPAAVRTVGKLLLALLIGHAGWRRGHFATTKNHTVAGVEQWFFSIGRRMLTVRALHGTDAATAAVLSGRALSAAAHVRHLTRGNFTVAVK